jgi:protein tyrosine phosphatase (PTP) superfamily phosphohydrolase (DUF442 family)
VADASLTRVSTPGEAGPVGADSTPGRRALRGRTALLAILFLVLAAGFGWNLIENFRTVVPGCIYRSGQLSESSLESHIRRYHLRTIINLRGANRGEQWYEVERAVASRCGVQHYDMPTDSSYPPTPEELREWLHILDTCEKPALIHCQSGIDRTGLVAVVSLLRLDPTGEPDQARGQLGLSHGHLPWRANRSRSLAFLELYVQWLARQGEVHSPGRFGQWTREAYEPDPEWASHP